MFGDELNSKIEGWLGEGVKKHTNDAKHIRDLCQKRDFKQNLGQTTMNKKKKWVA